MQALSRRTYQWAYPGFTRWCETEALLRMGNADRAEVDVQRFGEQLENFGETKRYEVMYLRSRAVLAEWKADWPNAQSDLQAALKRQSKSAL